MLQKLTRLSVIVLLLGVFGCDSEINRSPTDVLGIAANLRSMMTLDPAAISESLTGGVMRNVCEPLMVLNEEDAREVMPGIAEHWSVNEDFSSYTFHIKPNLTFPSGNPVTAHDELCRRRQAGAVEDPLKVLAVFDLLEVGPVRVEPKRLVAPYRIVTAGRSESTELIYTFEEKVFDPREPASRNLAEMIAVQVAFNYGLFCRKMVFYGSFDELDRRFIREMAENTAREIYVKKFLSPNPFLVGRAARLPAEPGSRTSDPRSSSWAAA